MLPLSALPSRWRPWQMVQDVVTLPSLQTSDNIDTRLTGTAPQQRNMTPRIIDPHSGARRAPVHSPQGKSERWQRSMHTGPCELPLRSATRSCNAIQDLCNLNGKMRMSQIQTACCMLNQNTARGGEYGVVVALALHGQAEYTVGQPEPPYPQNMPATLRIWRSSLSFIPLTAAPWPTEGNAPVLYRLAAFSLPAPSCSARMQTLRPCICFSLAFWTPRVADVAAIACPRHHVALALNLEHLGKALEVVGRLARGRRVTRFIQLQ